MTDDHISLRDHFDALFKGHEKVHEESEKHRLELRDLLQRALDGVADALRTFKADSNEWRGTINDLIANHPNRIELTAIVEKFDAALTNLATKVDDVRSANLLQAGAKERGTDMRVAVIAIAGLVLLLSGTIIAAVVAFR